MILKIISIIGMLISVPVALYVWFVWGWYEGIVMVFNSVMNDPKSASNFAFGILRILLGNVLGVLSGFLVFWLSLGVGLIDYESKNKIRRRW